MPCKGNPMKGLISLVVTIALVQGCAAVSPHWGPVTLHSGQTVTQGVFYWATNSSCASLLRSVKSIEVIEGGQYIAASLKAQPVRTRCGNEVPGAVGLFTAKPVTAETKIAARILVTYDTVDGPTTSAHTIDFDIIP